MRSINASLFSLAVSAPSSWLDGSRYAVGGLCLTLLVVLFLLPFQGHGWGYRYMHGYIGVICLIAAHGWIRLVPAGRAATPAAWAPIAAACAFTMLVLLPAQALQIHAYVAPHARPFAAIAHTRADIVVVDERTIFYGEEFVRNDPFLRAKPVLLNLAQLEPKQIKSLCERGAKVSIFDRDVGAAHGALILDPAMPPDWPDARKAVLQSLPCLIPLAAR